MAEFTVEFAEGQLPRPTYEDYSVGVSSICFDDPIIHPITFNNNTTGDYVIGWNWNNPFGLPPGSIRIESFTDITEVIEVALNIPITVSYTSNTLKDNSTGLNLTYPYTLPISNLSNIVENFNQNEIECYNDGSSRYLNTRTRTIEYTLFDTGGNAGTVQKASYRNTAP